jgi:hypothetical protein
MRWLDGKHLGTKRSKPPKVMKGTISLALVDFVHTMPKSLLLLLSIVLIYVFMRFLPRPESATFLARSNGAGETSPAVTSVIRKDKMRLYKCSTHV